MKIPSYILRIFLFWILISPTPAVSKRILPSDINILKGLSPLNWVIKRDFICSSQGGASLQVSFFGTRNVIMYIDPSNITSTTASRYPIISWSVNNGPFQDFQLTRGKTSVVLASQIQNPVIDLYLKGFSPFENRYTGDTPVNSVKITGFELDPGGHTISSDLPSKIWMNIGNSILSGDAALYKEKQGRPPDSEWAYASDARTSYGFLLADHFNYRETRIATGGYNWNGGLAGIPELVTLLDNITSTCSRLTGNVYHLQPDVVMINLGENGKSEKNYIITALTKIRSRVKPSTQIIVMVPVSGNGRETITSAFQSYKNSSGDNAAFFVDLGDIAFPTADGQHPTKNGHEEIFNEALPYFEKIVTKTVSITEAARPMSQTLTTLAVFDVKGRSIIRLGNNINKISQKFGIYINYEYHKGRICIHSIK